MEKKKVTVRDRVAKVLNGRKKGLSPTEIGVKLGYESAMASASVGPALKKLVEQGAVIREGAGKKVTYRGAVTP